MNFSTHQLHLTTISEEAWVASKDTASPPIVHIATYVFTSSRPKREQALSPTRVVLRSAAHDMIGAMQGRFLESPSINICCRTRMMRNWTSFGVITSCRVHPLRPAVGVEVLPARSGKRRRKGTHSFYTTGTSCTWTPQTNLTQRVKGLES